MKIGKDWPAPLFGLVLFGLILVTFSAQEAFADTVFQDTFDLDPESNGWIENIVQVPVNGFPATATGEISANGEGQVVLKKTGKVSALELSITKSIDTTGFEDITFALVAKQSMGNYEQEDYIRIEYDSGDGFVTLLEDHEVWMGPGGPIDDGNTVFTSSGDLSLDENASDNANLVVRLTVFVDEINEDVFFDDFIVKGESVSSSSTEEIEELAEEIEELIEDEELNEGQANSLLSKLQNIINKLNNGQTNAACNQLNSFINEVNAYINGGNLSADDGDNLIEAAEAVQDEIGC